MATVETRTSPKEQLIETGIRLFAELNGHEVSNRRLAREAEVNHAMINYHFGSRDGLCEAVFTRAPEEWTNIIIPILNEADEAISSAMCRADLEPSVRRLVNDLLHAVIGGESSKFMGVLLNDDLTTPQCYFDRLFDEVLSPFHLLAAKLAMKAMEKGEIDLECIVTGQTLVAQCMTFFRGRVLLLRKLGPIRSDAEKDEIIIRVVSESIVLALGLKQPV